MSLGFILMATQLKAARTTILGFASCTIYHFSEILLFTHFKGGESTPHTPSHNYTHTHTCKEHLDSFLFVWYKLFYPGQRSKIMHPVTHLDDNRGGSAQCSGWCCGPLCYWKSCIIRLRFFFFLCTETQERLSQAVTSMQRKSGL